jgi:hypothetical protein
MNIPTKPIESATIFFAGDRSVGISSASFDLEMFFDPNCFTPEQVPNCLKEIKNKIKDLYESIQGETPNAVLFDYEILAEQKSEEDLGVDFMMQKINS